MLTESAQRVINEEVTDIIPRMERMRKAARSGGPNQEAYIKSRCDAIIKMLGEIQEKA
jgi:hypothetical protein